MSNAIIAETLLEEARQMAEREENLYRVQAFRRAAAVVQGLDRPVVVLDETALRAIPGIGRALARKISGLAQTAECASHKN